MAPTMAPLTPALSLAAALLVAPPAAPAQDALAPGPHRVEVHGLAMYYEVRGDGPPLVLLHGGLHGIEGSFGRVLPALAARRRVIAVEQIGHGHTPDADRPFRYADMAEDTAALLARIGVGPADLLGWSDGGIVALFLAARHPERVRRVVVSGANARLDGMEPAAVRGMRDTPPERMARDLAALREAYAAASPDGAGHWPVVVAKARAMWLAPVGLEPADLARIAAPTLLVAGDRDLVRPEHEVELLRSIRSAQLLILPGTGHRTFDARADWVLPVVWSFLDAPATQR